LLLLLLLVLLLSLPLQLLLLLLLLVLLSLPLRLLLLFSLLLLLLLHAPRSRNSLIEWRNYRVRSRDWTRGNTRYLYRCSLSRTWEAWLHMELWRRRVFGSLRLRYRNCIVDIHSIPVRRDVPLNSGSWIVVFTLVDGRRRRRRAHIFAAFTACVCEKRSFFEIGTVATIYLTLIVILNHGLRFGAHVCGNGSEICAEMSNVFNKVALLWHRPIA
jgi:hypothetical protein